MSCPYYLIHHLGAVSAFFGSRFHRDRTPTPSTCPSPRAPCPLRLPSRKTSVPAPLRPTKLVMLMFPALPYSTGVRHPVAQRHLRVFFLPSSVLSSFLCALCVKSFFLLAICFLLLLPGGAFSSATPQAPPQAPPQTQAPAKKTQPPAGEPAAKTSGKPAGKASSEASGKSSSKAKSTKHHSSKTNSKGSKGRQHAQRAPTPERISEVQSALAGAGHYSGQPTGKWDASTVQAMKHYQQANGLPTTGKLDARSLQKLGLGSPIAGVAAPRPPADTPSLSTPPTTPPTTPPSTPHP
jgi:peptidoglycan hydrolase-like protein with peptidoglycan-binding domain